jgi:hypothetical protein
LDNLESGAYSNDLLRRVGMEIAEGDPGVFNYGASIEGVETTKNASIVVGGKPLAIGDKGGSIYSAADYGAGRIAVFSDPDLFFNYELGDISANLTEKTARLTRLEFEIVKSLAENIDN